VVEFHVHVRIAKHDAYAAREVLAFYEDLIESFVGLGAALYPSIDLQRLREIGHLIAMLTEGGTVLFAGPGKRAAEFDAVRAMAIEFLMQLLDSAAADSSRASTATRAARRRKRRSG
jgi:hypothetical protein